MKILAFIIFWIIGIVIALLGNKKIREYYNCSLNL